MLIDSGYYQDGAPDAATEMPTPSGKPAVGVVLPTKDEPRWIQDQIRFLDAFKAAGYGAEILFSQGDAAQEKANVESLVAKGVKVLIICPQGGSEVLLEVKNWNAYDPTVGRDILKDVTFNVRKGEIVGLAGLMGSGRTELALSVFGNPKGYKINGDVYIGGKKQHFTHPRGDSRRCGLCH